MKNVRFWRVSLIAAMVVSVMLSVTGGTIAWFTDTVESDDNIIASGTLDVEMQWADGKTDPKNTTWKDASVGAIFNHDLWEPGYTEVRHMAIANVGTLALKYQLSIEATGETSALTDAIDVYYTDPAVQVTDRAALTDAQKIGTLTEVLAGISSSAAGNLQPGDSHVVTLALKMRESAGNEYQNLAIGSDFTVKLVATQLTSEEDSFDNQYDAGAEYPLPVEVTSQTTFAEIADLLAQGKSIYAAESISITDPANGNTQIVIDSDVEIRAAKDAVITFGETTLLKGNGSITVYSGSLKTNYELCVTGDATLVIEGGEHTFGAFSATSNGKIVVNGGTLNCKGTYAGVMGISFAENGSLIVNDGLLNMYQPFNLNANRCDNAYIEINGGRIELLNGIENLFVVRNIMDKDRVSGVLRGSKVRVNGGTFMAYYKVDSAGDATSFIRNGDAPADTNKVLVSNTFNGNADYDCIVTGGTFYGSWQRADNQRYVNGNGGNSDGLFVENSIAGFVAEGYQITGDPDTGYVVSAK